MSDWVEIVVPTGPGSPPGVLEEIAAVIASEVGAAAAGTEQRGDAVVFWVDANDAASALAETRRVVAEWVKTAGAVADSGLIGSGVPDPSRIHSAQAAPEAEWRDAWKRYFKVSRLTRQFVVVPSWERYEPTGDDIVIGLDPGMAFGTGTHASTRLVLEELQQLADDGTQPQRILDLGCGSGILAIAAAKRWPNATCVAIDVDSIAVEVTRENAAINQVTERIVATTESITESDTFSLVVANIQADVLTNLVAMLVAHTAGTLVLSGLLTEQAAPLAREFEAAGMHLVRIRPSTTDPQWSSVTLRAATASTRR